jgi:hypothetical protein
VIQHLPHADLIVMPRHRCSWPRRALHPESIC